MIGQVLTMVQRWLQVILMSRCICLRRLTLDSNGSGSLKYMNQKNQNSCMTFIVDQLVSMSLRLTSLQAKLKKPRIPLSKMISIVVNCARDS